MVFARSDTVTVWGKMLGMDALDGGRGYLHRQGQASSGKNPYEHSIQTMGYTTLDFNHT